MNETIDLGGGVSLRVSYGTKVMLGEDTEVGGILRHSDPRNPAATHSCAIAWVWTEHQPVWTLVTREPLTLTPSIQCYCGLHGHITNGKWVPA